MATIQASGLRKSYGSLEALKGVDIEVSEGECFAFLGPNGAGKTTVVEILEGYRPRSGGEARVLGKDPADFGRRERERIGVVLQSCNVQAELTVRESIQQYAGYYTSPLDTDRVLDLVGLREQSDQRAGRLSGGQQRRLDVGLALVGDPELIFLDEPTTGFDPSARRQAWEVVDGLKELGKTIFLTTHYMDEAEALADRVAVIFKGRIVAEGSPATLGGRDRAETVISCVLSGSAERQVPAFEGNCVRDGDALHLRTPEPVVSLHVLTGWARETGVDLLDLQVHRPTLEDIYLGLTREHEEEDG